MLSVGLTYRIKDNEIREAEVLEIDTLNRRCLVMQGLVEGVRADYIPFRHIMGHGIRL